MRDSGSRYSNSFWVVVSAISALVTIFVFVSGKSSLGMVFHSLSLSRPKRSAKATAAPTAETIEPSAGDSKNSQFYSFKFDVTELSIPKYHIYRANVLLDDSDDYYLMTLNVGVIWDEVYLSVAIMVKHGLDHQVPVNLGDFDMTLVDGVGDRYSCSNPYRNLLLFPGEGVNITYRFKRLDDKSQKTLPEQPIVVYAIHKRTRLMRSAKLTLDKR